MTLAGNTRSCRSERSRLQPQIVAAATESTDICNIRPHRHLLTQLRSCPPGASPTFSEPLRNQPRPFGVGPLKQLRQVTCSGANDVSLPSESTTRQDRSHDRPHGAMLCRAVLRRAGLYQAVARLHEFCVASYRTGSRVRRSLVCTLFNAIRVVQHRIT